MCLYWGRLLTRCFAQPLGSRGALPALTRLRRHTLHTTGRTPHDQNALLARVDCYRAVSHSHWARAGPSRARSPSPPLRPVSLGSARDAFVDFKVDIDPGIALAELRNYHEGDVDENPTGHVIVNMDTFEEDQNDFHVAHHVAMR